MVKLFYKCNLQNSVLAPRYLFTSPDRFFDSGEYGGRHIRCAANDERFDVSKPRYPSPGTQSTFPKGRLRNAPAEEDRPVTGALLTIWLENGKIEPFIEAA